MKLYLLRHATAVDVAPSDADRELTREGKEEARIAGAALAKLGAEPDRIWSSPLVRARQTAEIAAGGLGFERDIELVDELQNGRSLAVLLRALRSAGKVDEIVLVGHLPSLAEHLGGLIGNPGGVGLSLSKGSVACLKLEKLQAGQGQLHWLMRQKQLRSVL